MAMECPVYYEYRCNGRYYQQRKITFHGNRCQYRTVGNWTNVVLGCPGSGE